MTRFHPKRSQIALLVSSVVFFALLFMAAWRENNTEWKQHQNTYASLILEKAKQDGRPPTRFVTEIKQAYLPGLERVDRCVTCHIAIDDPAFQNESQPLRAHSGDILKNHPADKFGCTICHQGQGRATSTDAAHGNIEHWPEPMLKGKLVYTSCGKCHYENDLYAGQSDLYGQVKPVEFIRQGELESGLPGADIILQGKRLVVEQGCLGCHQYRGRGGRLGPDITYVGDKTKHDFEFTHVEGDHSVENWLFTHFKSPKAVVPNTTMPDLNLSDDDARILAAYMMSLKKKNAPAAYTPLPRPVSAIPVRGESLYKLYCSACHGSDGVGAVVRNPDEFRRIDWPTELMTPSLRNIDTLGVASDDFLHHIVENGRSGTSMPAWKKDGGLSEDEISLLVSHIRNWEPKSADRISISAARGNARYGASLYRSNCVGCHGYDGEGGDIGVSLRSSTFLALVSDRFLSKTILDGRANTAMPAWSEFNNREMSDLLAHIRSWQPLESNRDKVLAEFQEITFGNDSLQNNRTDPQIDRRVRYGESVYRSRCAVCHGEDGKGNIGPSLNNQSVLSVVSNEFLFDTIVHGRPGTAMPAWRQLRSEQVVDLIYFMRSWQKVPAKTLKQFIAQGDWQNGQILFKGMCSSCHGPDAEGAIGPQLVNANFLRTVKDELLREWISHGRTGTQMRANLKGSQGLVELTESQIEDIITFLRYHSKRSSLDGQRIGTGFAPRGKTLYMQMCAQCHGDKGEGMTGPGIGNASFLRTASDGYLRGTIVLGRDGTEMRSMGHGGTGLVELKADEIDDLIAYLRNFPLRPDIVHRFVIGANPDRGKVFYKQYCSSCHGDDGKGFQNKTADFAPHLNNPEFLKAATDGYLQATLIRGRRGTAMRSFGRGGHGVVELPQKEINDIIAFIRQWSSDTRPLRRTEPFSKLKSKTGN